MKHWPLYDRSPLLPDAPGCFGVFRKHHRHEGVDLYCKPGTSVVAVEDGEVVKVEWFTGPEAGSPWWNSTQAVLIEGESGVLVYGEIAASLKVGQKVGASQLIGFVTTPVLKKDKGRPMVMLHFEQMAGGSRETLEWGVNKPQPENLLNPTDLLLEAADYKAEVFDLRTWDRSTGIGVPLVPETRE